MRNRYCESRKIYFSEQPGIRCECAGIAVHTGQKKGPDCVAGKIKEELRYAVCTQLCDIAKDDQMRNRGQHRVDKEPKRPQNRLHICDLKAALCEERNQFPVLPDLFKLQVEQVVL